MEDKLMQYAIENAVKFNGTASSGAVIGHMLKDNPRLKENIQELQKKVEGVIAKVNAMSPEEQKKQFLKYAPSQVKPKEKDIFAFLKIKPGQKIVTAFPPGPEKYPHIGHAKAIILNYLLARKYHGKFILRFEDTNPTLVRDKFYSIMQENFKWLGVEWDEQYFASDYMALFYDHARALVEDGYAYMCRCSPDVMSENRKKSVPCACRENPVSQHLLDFNQFKVMEPGKIVLRMKIDLEHKNSAMRDPTIMRIIDEKHARQGVKYRLWPTYDFQNAIMDGENGVTHRLRSKEFEMRNELQRHIQTMLGYIETHIYEFARFNLEGVESSGRIIRQKIENNELSGWDDPSLTTIVALRRRGFTPEAIKNFVVSTGISKSEATLTWDDLIVQNRRILDPIANRYFFVENPHEIIIEDAPKLVALHKLHPDHPGTRKIESHRRFYITQADYEDLSPGPMYRLMDLLNFHKHGNMLVFMSTDYLDFKGPGKKIMHYLPVADNLASVEVLMPDKTIVKGFAEPGVKDLARGEIVQFERFGFCRLDEVRDDAMRFWFTHK